LQEDYIACFLGLIKMRIFLALLSLEKQQLLQPKNGKVAT